MPEQPRIRDRSSAPSSERWALRILKATALVTVLAVAGVMWWTWDWRACIGVGLATAATFLWCTADVAGDPLPPTGKGTTVRRWSPPGEGLPPT